MLPSGSRLYTWVDVEDVFLKIRAGKDPNQHWPSDLLWANASRSSLDLGIKPGSYSAIQTWLERLFEARLIKTSDDQLMIRLESLIELPRNLPIFVEEDDDDQLSKNQLTPQLSHPSTIFAVDRESLDQPEAPAPLDEKYPPIFAFHSFKGGVGRTTHAMAFAEKLLDEFKNADDSFLVIDADLEAPGISWIFDGLLGEPSVSFADLLALAHEDSSDQYQTTIDLVANRLSAQRVDRLFVMPVFRQIGQLNTAEILPQHFIRGSQNPFSLTDLISHLGWVLGVRAIIIDLRAGLTELSSAFLLDPRIYRVFVTTLSQQSILGTCSLLRLIGDRSPNFRECDIMPQVILSQLPIDRQGLEQIKQEAEQALTDAAAQLIDSRDTNQEEFSSDEYSAIAAENLTEVVKITPTYHSESLQIQPNHWTELKPLLQLFNLNSSWEILLDAVRGRVSTLEVSSNTSELSDSTKTNEQRQKLAEAAKKMIFAENAESDRFLPTNALHNLASSYSKQAPIEVIIGSKGSGKTYTFLQVIRCQTWARFIQETNDDSQVNIQCSIGIVLHSGNLSDQAKRLVSACKIYALNHLSLPHSRPVNHLTQGQTRDINVYAAEKIRGWLRGNLTESEWIDCWLDLMAWQLDFNSGVTGAGRSLINALLEKRQSVIMLFDGLEDIFQEIGQNPAQQTALRSLLQSVPEWLSQYPARPLGVLIFVRSDFVKLVIKQNLEQFRTRYDRYALRWGLTEALQLVLWVCSVSEVIEDSPKSIQAMTNQQELITKLEFLWGKLVGSAKSREATSWKFVLAALCDFNIQIQSRDLVRFLHESAKDSYENTKYCEQEIYFDRLLVPGAMRDALSKCAYDKINEIIQENPSLDTIFSKLRDLDQIKKKVPFNREDLELTTDEVKSLEIEGAVFRDPKSGYYWLTEMLRLGLGFTNAKGGRSPFLGLWQKALKRSGLA
jgi:MinD-like ATPase involved in chromosome partitioning or flagellar assembly